MRSINNIVEKVAFAMMYIGIAAIVIGCLVAFGGTYLYGAWFIVSGVSTILTSFFINMVNAMAVDVFAIRQLLEGGATIEDSDESNEDNVPEDKE